MTSNDVRALLVEDNPGDARLIQETLAGATGTQFAIEHVDRLSLGLDRVPAGGLDLVLLDLGLPDSQGLETLARMQRVARHLPIIVLTGLNDELAAVEAVHNGAQDYLVKGQAEGHPMVRSLRYAIERKQAQQQLLQSEQRLRTVIRNAPVVLFVLDRRGVLTMSDGAALKGFGLEPGALVGQPVSEIITSLDVERETPGVTEVVGRALAGEPLRSTIRLREKVLDTQFVPLREGDGSISGVIAVGTDITDAAQAQDALRLTLSDLERKAEELESFNYSVSHDLKEPLRTLEAFSRFLLEDCAEQLDEKGRDYLVRMGSASARLKQMIEDLLVLSRVARKPEALVRVDVGQLVADVVAAMQATIEGKHAAVEVEGRLPAIAADLTRGEQIFGNLIANGLKFNHSQRPLVSVGVREVQGALAVFYVRDNGIGIDPQYHDRIFEVFQRLHPREEYEGTGAGLAIVKRAVQALGGRIWLQSSTGAGATFFIALPLWEKEPGALGGQQEEQEAGRYATV